MKTVQPAPYNVYNLEELSDKAKEKARDWYRGGMDQDIYWSESVTDDVKTILGYLGFEIKYIHWSGFWSQGDGACFAGKWRAADVNLKGLLEYAPGYEDVDRVVARLSEIAINAPSISFSVEQSGYYQHENCTAFDFDEEVSEEYCEELAELSKDLMRWIYSRLEQAWDFENSNETVDENIINNEYEFLESGERA